MGVLALQGLILDNLHLEGGGGLESTAFRQFALWEVVRIL